MGERKIDQGPLARPQLGTCRATPEGPDLESNMRPLSLRDDSQPTKPHQSGHKQYFKYLLCLPSHRWGD